MSDALEEHDGSRKSCQTCTRYKMEISVEKTKLTTNSANDIHREIKVKMAEVGYCNSFKYLGAVV